MINKVLLMISLSGGGENGEEYIVETADEEVSGSYGDEDSGSAFKPSDGDDIIKKTTKK